MYIVSILQAVLLAGAFQGTILGIMLFKKQHNQLPNKILSFLTLLVSVHLVLVAFDNRAFFQDFPHFSKITWVLPVLYGPLILLYVKKFTGNVSLLKWKDSWVIIPFVLYVAYLFPYFIKSAAEKRAYLDNFELARVDDFGFLNQATNLIHLFFATFSVYTYHKFIGKLKDNYSDIEKVRFSWLQRFLHFVLAVIVISILVFYARKYQVSYFQYLYPYHFLGVVTLLYWIGYKSLMQPPIFHFRQATVAAKPMEMATINLVAVDDSEEEEEQVKYQKSGLTEEQQEALKAKLLQYMETEKPYLHEGLTIQDLAASLETSRHHLSFIINKQLNCNFYEFVNDYRYQEFIKLATNPACSKYTLLALALQAGFNSKTTFNTFFKKKTGTTPSAYFKEATAKIVA